METDLGRFVGSCCGQISGRCWADFSACKSATQRLQIGDPVFANLRFATVAGRCRADVGQSFGLANPCSCCCKYLQHQTSAQHLLETCPGDCVKNLPEAVVYRQAQWQLIWAYLCAAVAGRFRADVGQMFRLANRRPNVCKSATQCLQIGDPYWTTNPVFRCSNL